jgi:hypothetical protein
MENITQELKDYIKRQITLTEEERALAVELYFKHRLPAEAGFVPMNTITVEFQLTTIGTGKVAHIGGKKFILNEDELNNL